MNLFETTITDDAEDTDLTNYYASPRNGGIRMGYDKVIINFLFFFLEIRINRYSYKPLPPSSIIIYSNLGN